MTWQRAGGWSALSTTPSRPRSRPMKIIGPEADMANSVLPVQVRPSEETSRRRLPWRTGRMPTSGPWKPDAAKLDGSATEPPEDARYTAATQHDDGLAVGDVVD